MVLKSFDDVHIKGGNKRRWSDGLEPYKWVKGWQRIRLYGDIYTDARHTIKTKTGKFYTENCLAYDWQNDAFVDDREAACENCRMKIQVGVRHYINVFSLDAWEKQPKNPSPDWTCIFMADFPPSLIKSILDLKPLNKNASISDPLKGAVLNIKFDPNSDSPANMYYAAVETANWAFEPDMLNLTLVQELEDGKRIVHKGDDKLPPQWRYNRGATVTLREQKESLRRNGYYGEEASDTNSEVSKVAADAISQLNEIDSAPAPRSNVKNVAILRNDTPDEAPPPKKVFATAAPAAEAAKLSSDDGDLEIPFNAAPERPSSSQGQLKAPDSCPTKFGDFARATACFTVCKVRRDCEKNTKALEETTDDSL